MINGPRFAAMIGPIKAVWDMFLRGVNKDNKFDGLCFDPYGQCRSVALARIMSVCLNLEGAPVLDATHLSQSMWHWQCWHAFGG